MKKLIFSILYRVRYFILLYNRDKYKNKVSYYEGDFPNYNKVIMNNDEIIQKIIYKDNRWNYIRCIGQLMWNDMFKFRPFQYRCNSIDNICEDLYIKRENSSIKCEIPSKNKNEWIFLRIPNRTTNYELSFDAVVKTINTEFQIAFNYENIGRRYRFNLVNNQRINFDIIENGIFYNSLISTPFTLKLDELYHFKLKVNENKYQYIINGNIVMSVQIKAKNLLKGDIILILWNSGANPINVIYKNLNLKTIAR